MTHIIGCIRAEEQHIKFHVGPTDTRDVSNLGDVATSPTSTNEDAEEWNPKHQVERHVSPMEMNTVLVPAAAAGPTSAGCNVPRGFLVNMDSVHPDEGYHQPPPPTSPRTSLSPLSARRASRKMCLKKSKSRTEPRPFKNYRKKKLVRPVK